MTMLPMWIIFGVVVILMLFVDIRTTCDSHVMSMKKALTWTGIWVTAAGVFAWVIWGYFYSVMEPAIAEEKTIAFLSGYLIEKSLSLDNVFVFIMIFSHFHISPRYQRKILLYGVLSAIFLRLIMILMGVWLIERFSWLLYLFGIFLVLTGIKMFFSAEKVVDLEMTWAVRLLKKILPLSMDDKNGRFTFVENGKRFFTPLMMVLILIEISDIVFAVDSIPAIFAITTDPFIVFSSNIFAILGLRALYFVLADMMARFYFLKYALSALLVFVGLKMLLSSWIHIPALVSLAIIASIIFTTIFMGMFITKKKHE